MDEFLSSIKDDGLRRLYQYWDGKRAGRRFPARVDIDPLDFPYILGWVALLDVSYNPLRFRYRLHGSELVEYHGVDMTGKFLDEHPREELRQRFQRGYASAIEQRGPTHASYDRVVDDRLRGFESLRLPLSSDGTTIDVLMIAARHRDL